MVVKVVVCTCITTVVWKHNMVEPTAPAAVGLIKCVYNETFVTKGARNIQ